MQAKKYPRCWGADTGHRMILVADFTAAHPILIAHPAHTISGTGQFEPETMRVMAQSDVGWLAEYEAAEPLVTPHDSRAILAPSPKGMVIRTTLSTAVYSPTEESGVLLCPEFNTTGNLSSCGCGLGASVRKADDVAVFTVLTPSPPDAIRTVSSGFSVHTGTETMKPTTTPSTQGNTHHDHHQAELLFRAQNHLALALFELRNSTGTTPTRKAMGLAYAAGRALSQVCGGAHHV